MQDWGGGLLLRWGEGEGDWEGVEVEVEVGVGECGWVGVEAI